MNLEAQQALTAAFDVAAPRRRASFGDRHSRTRLGDPRRAGDGDGRRRRPQCQRAGDVPAKLRRRDARRDRRAAARSERCRRADAVHPRGQRPHPQLFARRPAAADGVLNVSTNAFFAPVRGGANTFGPKIKYDRLAGRWFIIAATDALPGRIVIASSNASTITASTLWSFFAFDNTGFPGAATCAVDSPTLGLDPYALYIGVVQFCDPGGDLHGHVRLRRPQDLGDRLCHDRGDAVPRPDRLVGRRRSVRAAGRRQRRSGGRRRASSSASTTPRSAR